jgi:hypothetical protein
MQRSIKIRIGNTRLADLAVNLERLLGSLFNRFLVAKLKPRECKHHTVLKSIRFVFK